MDNDRSTAVDDIIKILGWLAVIGGFVCAVAFWPGGHIKPGFERNSMVVSAITFAATGIISGVLLIGFGHMIRILDEIRAILRSSEPASPAIDAERSDDVSAPDLDPMITENPDGTFAVMGRAFNSRDTAEAFLDRYGPR